MAIVSSAFAEYIEIGNEKQRITLNNSREKQVKKQRREPGPQAPVVGNYMRIITSQQVDKKNPELITILKRWDLRDESFWQWS
jgi:hypothetical protein